MVTKNKIVSMTQRANYKYKCFFLRKDKVQGRCFLVWSKPWLCCQKVINDGNPIFSFTFIFSLEFGLFHFYKHTLFSLLRHHPSAVSCDDSDLLLEESCVMDISTEVKIIWIIMIWGGITIKVWVSEKCSKKYSKKHSKKFYLLKKGLKKVNALF